MRLQADISDDSRKKIYSYKALLEQRYGKEITVSEAVESYIQNARIE